MEERYNHLNKYLKEKFGERVLKICIDGGFTCPNRDGSKGSRGCVFCSERGSGEHLRNIAIETQVKNHIASYRGERANKFIAYFQNFSNTYDTVQNLKIKYDSALCDDRIVGLEIATRPDCINEEIAKLLEEYAKKYYVVVELGLQTSNDEIGKLINRCYTTKDFEEAVKLLAEHNIEVVAHVMVGLPNETFEDMYKDGLYTPMQLDEYINRACYIISHLRKDVIIHRVSGDAPKDKLVAPEWNAHKKWIMNGIDKKLREEDLWQGKYLD